MTTENQTDVVVGLDPAQALAAKQKVHAAIAELLQPTTRTVYPFQTVSAGATSLLAYSGDIITLASTDKVPENASPWKPPVVADGLLPYFDNGVWRVGLDITKLTLTQHQTLALNQATAEFDLAVESLHSGYSAAERTSWSAQLSQAQALVDSGAISPMLSALASARGTDPQTLAQKIVSKNSSYTASYTTALAALQKARTSIQSATDASELPALTLHSLQFLQS